LRYHKELAGRKFWLLLLVLTSSVLLAWPLAVGLASPDATTVPLTQGNTSFIRQIPLRLNDLVYNPTTHLLYGSIPSAAGPGGNSIVSIDPANGTFDTPVFIGSEPTRIVLADDAETLYVSLEGSASVRRFNVSTHVPGPEFSVGQDSFDGIYRATDIAVAPGNPNLVAVARSKRGSSPPQAGVAVFDNGVQRPTTGPGHDQGSDYLAFSDSASTLYGAGFNGALRTMSINASGVTQTNGVAFSGIKIRFDNGRVYGSVGQVFNPVSGTLVGTFSGVANSSFTTDSSVGRAYFLTGSQVSTNYSVVLRAFDINTFLQVGSLTVSGINGPVTSLVRWGSNGLAFSTQGGQLFLIQTALIPSADPIPTPTPTPFPSPTSTPTPVPLFIRQIALPNNDIAYSPATGLFYASVPSSAGSTGNSIQSVDPETGSLGTPVFIGSEPTKLALSDDNQTLYVGLEGAAAVRRFNLVSQTAEPQFPLAFGNIILPVFPYDIAVVPGNPNSVAVSRTDRITSPNDDGVAIYDNGVPRPSVARRSTFGVEYSNTPDKLYSFGASGGVDRLSADSSGVHFLSNVETITQGDLRFDGGLLYGSRGDVLDPVTGFMKGSFTGFEPGGNAVMTTDIANGRAYFLNTDGSSLTATLRAFDLNTFVPLGAVSFPIPNGSPVTPVSTLLRWGTNGLAFRNGSYVIFIQTDLVSNGGVIPSPTPTPSPSPSATPLFPTFVRTVNLPANDLAYVSTSGQIYASVPSSAGPNGNSVTRIDPQTGTVGESVFIGSEPNKMALSDDGNTLHVSLDGAAAIRRFDIPTLTPGTQFSWGATNSRPTDMAVVPGSPLSLAISGVSGTPVRIYDNGVARPSGGTGGAHDIQSIAFSSPSVMYGYESGSSGFALVKFTLDANGLSGSTIASNLISGFSNKIGFAGGLLYSAGRVVDPEARTIKGTFQNSSRIFTVDTALGRLFSIDTNGSTSVILRAYDINTFLPLGTATLPGVTGNPVRLVRWGVNGLAFNTTDSSDPTLSKVYVIQSALVSNAAPIPTGVQLSANKYFVSESSPTLSVQVIRTGDVSTSSSINFATSDGTATAGVDYTAVSGTLTFAPGQLSRTIPIPIIDDQIFEGPAETFNLTLSNPTGASLETPPSAQITINDTEQKPTLFASNLSMTEGDSGTKVFSVPVTLTNASVDQISINYTTENGSATAGTDYVAKSGVLTFAPGTTQASVDITVNSDTVAEPDETFLIKFSNPVNAFNGTSSLQVTIANDDSTIQFGSANYSIAEDGNSLLVTINRVGEVQGSKVDYSTTDLAGANNCNIKNGKASARCDFITTLGTLTFATGETSKTISIPIVDDAYAEGPETFSIALTNSVGMTVLTPAVTVTITDNEASDGTTNPSDIASRFVRQHYIDFLNREPDAGGLAFWTNEITSCGSDSQCLLAKRVNVSAAFFLSIEFQETGYFVYRVYKSAFGNLPGAPVPVTFNPFLKDTQLIGSGLQVGVGDWQLQLENNKQAYQNAFVQRADFQLRYPSTMTAQQFVDQMNNNTGGVLTPSQVSSLVAFLNAAPASTARRASVLRSIADSTVLRNAEFNKAFVLMQYFGYLRRNPNDAPDTDFAGFNFWLGKLDSFGGNYIEAEMVKAFIVSIEYRQRFGP
jgi:sugar lactone lactonase YvrE